MAEAFTNAFVRVKVLEVQSQLSSCLDCTCGEEGYTCEELDDVSTCMTTGTLEYTWVQSTPDADNHPQVYIMINLL